MPPKKAKAEPVSEAEALIQKIIVDKVSASPVCLNIWIFLLKRQVQDEVFKTKKLKKKVESKIEGVDSDEFNSLFNKLVRWKIVNNEVCIIFFQIRNGKLVNLSEDESTCTFKSAQKAKPVKKVEEAAPKQAATAKPVSKEKKTAIAVKEKTATPVKEKTATPVKEKTATPVKETSQPNAAKKAPAPIPAPKAKAPVETDSESDSDAEQHIPSKSDAEENHSASSSSGIAKDLGSHLPPGGFFNTKKNFSIFSSSFLILTGYESVDFSNDGEAYAFLEKSRESFLVTAKALSKLGLLFSFSLIFFFIF